MSSGRALSHFGARRRPRTGTSEQGWPRTGSRGSALRGGAGRGAARVRGYAHHPAGPFRFRPERRLPDPVVRRRRRALQLCFGIPGFALATWVTRTPDVRDRLDASIAEMGLVLFGMSIGSMLGVLVAGALVARFCTRPAVITGMALVPAGSGTTALGTALSSAPLVASGLLLIGAGMGLPEVASNVDGADVERAYGRPVLPALHGCA